MVVRSVLVVGSLGLAGLCLAAGVVIVAATPAVGAAPAAGRQGPLPTVANARDLQHPAAYWVPEGMPIPVDGSWEALLQAMAR